MPQRYVHNSEPLHMFNRNKKNTVPSEQFRRKVCRLPKKAITLKGAMTFRNIEFSKVFSHMLILANFHKVTTSTHDPSALPPPHEKMYEHKTLSRCTSKQIWPIGTWPRYGEGKGYISRHIAATLSHGLDKKGREEKQLDFLARVQNKLCKSKHRVKKICIFSTPLTEY